MRERQSRRGEAARADDAVTGERDVTPALGTPASPSRWTRARDGAGVALQQRGWADARWSYLYAGDTRYAEAASREDEVAAAARRARTGPPPPDPRGPFIKPPVWTWEIPLYFWFGGMAAGSSFVALGCELAGDRRSARIARIVSLGALMPSPPLLIADLGRPARFYNMLRIFKPRSPMSMGSWCLSAFGGLLAGAIGADVLGRPRAARALTAGTAVTGVYLGSYTAVLLAGSNIPVWARSRTSLPPIFVCTATATGAAATRLALSAAGMPARHPTRTALAQVEAAAMGTELALSARSEHRLGRIGRPLPGGGRRPPLRDRALGRPRRPRPARRRPPRGARRRSRPERPLRPLRAPVPVRLGGGGPRVGPRRGGRGRDGARVPLRRPPPAAARVRQPEGNGARVAPTHRDRAAR